MGCNESLFPHKLFKSLAAAVQKTLHHLDRRRGRVKNSHCFIPSCQPRLQVSYKEFTVPAALSKCGDTLLFFAVTTLP